MASPKKKQKQAAKRKADKQAARRRESGSPIKRLAAAPGETECWATRDFQGYGQMSILVYKRAAGMHGIACFLVDRGVVGLKDCWTQLAEGHLEFDDMLREQREGGMAVGRMTVEEAGRWVAGAARWAHDNGMRLPKDWLRSVELIGGVGDWKAADVSAFTLEFAGHPDDLRQRLIGQPFDDYIQRTDIAFDFSDEATFLDQESGEYIDPTSDDATNDWPPLPPIEELSAVAANFAPAANELAAQTAAWLNAEGRFDPSPELVEAWQTVLVSTSLAKAAMPDADAADVEAFTEDLQFDIDSRFPPARVADYNDAIDQVYRHLEADALVMQNALAKFRPADTGPAPTA